eukprot:scaffold46445_cov59-Phaeocystis_antarctica.AAC.1
MPPPPPPLARFPPAGIAPAGFSAQYARYGRPRRRASSRQHLEHRTAHRHALRRQVLWLGLGSGLGLGLELGLGLDARGPRVGARARVNRARVNLGSCRHCLRRPRRRPRQRVAARTWLGVGVGLGVGLGLGLGLELG